MNALISVYKKDGADKLAEALVKKGYSIISSGGTYEFLKNRGIEVREVEDVTGFPEMLGGRVKTLHPKIHGGLLARRDLKDHMDTLKEHGIDTIDLVAVNLYPFLDKLSENLPFEDMVELIDIGGPSMLRSAAKNFRSVTVLSDPSQYDEFLLRLSEDRVDEEYRKKLAGEVFKLTSEYDREISNYLLGKEIPGDDLTQDSLSGDTLTLKLKKSSDLRYGENPHQKSAFYTQEGVSGFMTTFEKLWGKDLGYINYKDIESAWTIVCDFDEPCAAAVKHNTPCGIALGKDAEEAYVKCYNCDPLSIFGGITAVNRELDEKTAEEMTKIMLHCVIAPSFTEKALDILKKKKNLIIIKMNEKADRSLSVISSGGGILIQEKDLGLTEKLETVTLRKPTEEEMGELEFAFKAVKHVKSNAIVVSKDRATVGIGGGFVNRIDAAVYALKNADDRCVLASDAFFPFPDVVEAAHEKGIKAIIQPGGSLNDNLSVEKCDEFKMSMVMTGMRHFRH